MAQNRNQIVSSCDGREKVFKHGEEISEMVEIPSKESYIISA